jgi:hypothetical protein
MAAANADALVGPNAVGAGSAGGDQASLGHPPPPGWGRRIYSRTADRFPESRARILFTAAVRNEEVVVPIPDPLLSDEDTDFVAYIAPERKGLEAGLRQQLSSNEPIYIRPPVSGSDADEKSADLTETFANALRQEIVPWDAIIGKAVEDGEFGLTMSFSLDDFLAAPLPSDSKSPEEWETLPEAERDDWTEVHLSGGRTSYRRYKAKYWRDAEGRSPKDSYYRDTQDDGTRRAFERNDLATRRAWKEHAKALKAGQLPLTVSMVSATDCAPFLVRGKGSARWECRGLAIKRLYELDDLVQQGYRWAGLGSSLYPLPFDGTSAGRTVTVFEIWCYLEDDDGEAVPCIVYEVEGRVTEWYSEREQAYRPAVINLRDEYGLETLPASYFHAAHTESDNPDLYSYPAIYQLLSPILGREGAVTAYQAHLRKYAFSKRTVTPDPGVPKEAWLNADNSPRAIDMEADIVMLPGPMGSLVSPPEPASMKDLLTIYERDIDSNAPSDAIRGAGGSSASGHSLSLQEGYFLAANRHILECGRQAVQWIGETALEMLDALDEKHHARASVFQRSKPPADAQKAVKKSQAIELDPRWLKGNFTLNATYPKVGNLAEIQQTADLADRGYASFADVMEARGKQSVFNERVEVAVDRFWRGDEGMQMLVLEALKRRGDMERATLLEKQMQNAAMPGGLAAAAVPPELQAMAAGGGMPMGQPGAPPASGMQLPDIAQGVVNGVYSGALGSGAMMNDAAALAGAGLPGGVPVPGAA